MMDQPYELDQLLGELRDGPVLLSDRPEVDAQRQRLLPYLRTHVRQAPRLRRRERIVRRTLAGAAVGCASLLGVLVMNYGDDSAGQQAGVTLEPKGVGVVLTRPGSDAAALIAPIHLAAQGELTVSEKSAMTTSQGVQVELGRETRVGLDALAASQKDAKLRLVEGSVRCSVPPLGKTGSFSVITPDTEVIVHGTKFTVEVPDAEAPATCVRVQEGKVEVRHGAGAVFLGPGQFWGCDRDEASEPELTESEEETAAAKPEPIARNRAVAAALPRAKANPEPPKAPKTGTLAEETRLMSLALSAERKGQRTKARRLYSEIVNEYPDSPLAPDAKRGLSRVE